MLDLSNWDESTNMKPAGMPNRAEVVALTAGLRQKLISSEEFADLLAAAADEELTPMQHANLRVAGYAHKNALAIPADLLKESKRVYSDCEVTWQQARPNNDWSSVLPKLEHAIGIAIQISQCLGETFDLDPYDALMNQYEPGIQQASVDGMFADIREFLVNAVPKVEAAQQAPTRMAGIFKADDQLALAEICMQELGFDFGRGRLDQSAHPFSCGNAFDARITTRLSQDDFSESLFAVFHETGHARYTQNQPSEWVLQFAGEPTGMAVHESQSLFMEMQVCRSDAFLEFVYPLVEEHLRPTDDTTGWSLDNFRRAVRFVNRGLIRVYADEMTYPFHILLRYALEKQLCKGELAVKDIPDAWNLHMRDMLGVDTRGNYQDGCMQDIHWFAGLFGYFPCYLLGAIFAAQLQEACIHKIGEQTERIRQGDFSAISTWLAENIHAQGSLMEGEQLIQSVTGSEMSARSYISHLKRRYVDA
ncbi:MAG: carboxypeptidase M32 [Gammaproteobacteria bacterium]|nr:carboxypeptidase M32 [Gammaproteobacteria bacterium]